MRNSRFSTESIQDKKIRETVAWVILCLILLAMAFFTIQLSIQKSFPKGKKTETEKEQTKDKKSTTTQKPKPATQATEGIGRIKVKVNGLNLRSSPEVADNQIASLQGGTVLIVLSKEKNWYKVRTGDGAEGYVASNQNYVEIIEMKE